MTKSSFLPVGNSVRPGFIYFLICLQFALFTFISCKEDEPVSLNSGEITLSSKTFGTSPYYILGYSFEKQNFYKTISEGDEIDVYLAEILFPNGDLAGVQFSSGGGSGTAGGFYRNARFPDISLAEEFYGNYITADATDFKELSDTIRRFDIYTCKNRELRYIKFLVKDIHIVNAGSRADYINVDIKYFIQRDGTTNLAE